MSTRKRIEEERDIAAKKSAEADAYANERYRKTLASGGKPQDGTCFPAGVLIETSSGAKPDVAKFILDVIQSRLIDR